MNKITAIMSYIFCAVFVAAISAVACYFGRPGLLWWYVLPTLIAFVTTIVTVEDRHNGK